MTEAATPIGPLTPRFVEAGVRSIHTWEAGEGPPVLLLHGFTDDGSCWVSTIDVFTASGRRVIAPDARAHGRTPLLGDDDFTAVGRLADVIGLCEALSLDGLLVAGHSMGALTAMQLTAERPDLVVAAILIDPPLVSDSNPRHSNRPSSEDWAAEVGSMDPQALAARCRQDNPAWTDDEVTAWVSSKRLVDPALFGRRQSWLRREWRSLMRSIKRPTIVIAGDPDLGSLVDGGAEQWLLNLPEVEFERIPQAGHSVHRDRRDRFAEVVQRFMSPSE